MNDKKQAKNIILQKISTYLIQYGFDKKIHGQSFWKPIVEGRAMVHLSFINHENDFDITVSVSIRFDALEELINADNALLKPKEKLMTSSIGVELGNLTEGRQKRWSIYDESDVDPAVKSICEITDDAAIPYIEKYKNIETTYEMMLRDDQEIFTFAPLHHRRAMNAVGLAKLLGKDNIQEIGEAKRKFLSERNDYGLGMFNKFLEKILTNN
ncbi:hypothetical protein [Dehalobacter sp.]|uniref:hypothetical protein n=1 Tax=Dehalobacter sp. TaxID=1962289 RepID=UPI00258F8EB6|nr:hypothetical protein [Dehalobacter sp.]MCG1025142.1 hypothetical protein [Dehalobacter sp.]